VRHRGGDSGTIRAITDDGLTWAPEVAGTTGNLAAIAVAP
jgi:hypothetical protein